MIECMCKVPLLVMRCAAAGIVHPAGLFNLKDYCIAETAGAYPLCLPGRYIQYSWSKSLMAVIFSAAYHAAGVSTASIETS